MNRILVIPFFLLWQGVSAQSIPPVKLVNYVKPFIGTSAVDTTSLSGSNFPGPTTPFAFVQLSPDTRDAPDDPASGYDYNDKTIVGFSHTHLSGTGVADLFDVLLMPTTGEVKLNPGNAKISRSGYRSAFSHGQETARPGYYQVMLQDYGINAELTSASHTGMHRYTFPASTQSHIVIDMDHSLDKKRGYWECRIIAGEIKVINNHTIEGYRIITGWARLRKVYFHAEFSKPFDSVVMANGKQKPYATTLLNGTALKAALNFSTTDHEQVTVKVALSSVSIENAKQNMMAEIPGWDFDKISSQNADEWEKELSKIIIEGTQEQKEIFYTGLYHAFTQPNNIADINGDYQATDMTIRNAPDKVQYSTFSLWDTYRAAHPLYTLIQPEKTAGFINTMIRQYETYGYLPIWQLWGDENYCMIGNHAIPVITDAILKGIPGIDVEKAYQAVKASSTTDHPGSPFTAWEKYGYIPEDIESQSVSITVEMAYDDWCVAQLAKKLGKTADYERFIKRSAFYKNLYNAKTGFFQARNKDGNWLTPFDPLSYGGNGGSPYTEANAWQYSWYVPQNIPDLIKLMGGDRSFTAKLDTFFTLANKPGDINGNASGFIGQYAHGNEPSHHIAYLYDYAGQPWKTQYYVSKVLNELYNNSSSGYAGNEDCGQMSAWYIFSSMGFYPVNPANGIYAIGSPILKSASMTLSNDKIFSMSVKNIGKQNIYIQSVKLNGKLYNKTYITQDDIMNGSNLEFTMGAKPNKSWGTKAEDQPPLWGYKN
ncbi:putative alpha-1,2-mannosidase [Mucilaginibacter frigoritolerans]|uniref:Putative alpha-1,2-mannosidase n=1 Tax=Mucilaginibacter frigoritolerans TaxID=652788 RepID=A0A562TNF7_9SPHI|nr:GH92 family glycosyl hydrolase [Mucilaginibacter frigoritolerans]TWI94814.1 putative alpha-1,2-mannosidase [Mucilaginibacter frigoritolerans]